ncbi:MAG: oligoendopeptidase F [Melioribacteraceae bacterium]|nr:oligoendopeptidase F [Melioribacteraceae bacterium]
MFKSIESKNNYVRVFLFMVLTSLLLSDALYAQEESGELMKRDEIDSKYKWNVEDIYSSSEKWEEDFKWISSNFKNYSEFEGKLGESADQMLAMLKFDQKVGVTIGHLHLYAMLSRDIDLGNSDNQGRYNKLMAVLADVSAASSFITPEILSIPEDQLWKMVEENKDLKVYKQYFSNIIRTKKHTLSKDLEELLALSGPAMNVSGEVFSMFNNADIQFPTIKDSEGNEVKLSHGRYGAAMYSTDRDYRERVYKGIYEPYKDYKNTLASMFNGNIKSLMFNAKARKYESTRTASLDANNIPLSVYDNLVNTVNENLQPLHRWCALKKKVLGLEEFHPYDTYVTLFPSVKKEYTYEQSIEVLLEALKPMGEQYISDLKTAFDNRWIDVYETKGKRSGAYSSGTTYEMHPYVLLNWNNQLNDVFTFAHEMGHNMHSYYTGNTQPYPYADYSIFVAEVASTMNEALLLDYLLEHAETKEEKLALIEKHLINIVATFYRQTRFAEYEQLTHELTEKGEALTPDKLTELFGDMYKKYWGSEMVMDDEEAYSWARIPHFYYNFYVYQYATSFAASETLAAKIIEEGQPAIDKFLTFLKSGNSKYPIEVLKDAGVDMNSPEPIKSVVNKMNKLLDKMEELLAE